jgi:hypothetical protein
MIDPWAQFGREFQDGEQWVSFPSWSNVEEVKELTFTVGKIVDVIYLPLITK